MSKHTISINTEAELVRAMDWACSLFPEDSVSEGGTVTYFLTGHGNGKGLVVFEALEKSWTLTVDKELEGRLRYEL